MIFLKSFFFCLCWCEKIVKRGDARGGIKINHSNDIYNSGNNPIGQLPSGNNLMIGN